VILTLDKDFWQIALQRRKPLMNGGVVHFRAHPATVAKLLPIVGGLGWLYWSDFIRGYSSFSSSVTVSVYHST
jgi:hypothetical protein